MLKVSLAIRDKSCNQDAGRMQGTIEARKDKDRQESKSKTLSVTQGHFGLQA